MKRKKTQVDYLDVVLILAPLLMGLISLWSLALFAILCIRWNNSKNS